MNKTEQEIIDLCKKEGGRAWLSSTYFIEKLALSYDTTMKHLKRLVDNGFLEVKREARELDRQYGWEKWKSAWINWYRLKISEPQLKTQQTLSLGATEEE